MEHVVIPFLSGCIIGICLSFPIGASGLLVLRETYDRGSDAGTQAVGAPITLDLIAMIALLFLFSSSVVIDESIMPDWVKKTLAGVSIVVLVGLAVYMIWAAKRPAPERPASRPYFRILFAGLPTVVNIMVSILFFIHLFHFEILGKGNCAKIFFITGALLADFFSWVGWIHLGERMRSKHSFNLVYLNSAMAIIFLAFAVRILVTLF